MERIILNGDAEFLDFLEWAVREYDKTQSLLNNSADEITGDLDIPAVVKKIFLLKQIDQENKSGKQKVKFEELQKMGESIEWETTLEEDLALLKASK